MAEALQRGNPFDWDKGTSARLPRQPIMPTGATIANNWPLNAACGVAQHRRSFPLP